MKSTVQLNKLESVLIQLVAKGGGNWSWYEIGQALSRRDVPRETDMMVALKKLAVDGLLKRYVEPGNPRDRWEITPAGQKIIALNQLQD